MGLTAALLLLISACASTARKPLTVTIGADLSLTGTDQQVGQIYAQALKLQVRRLNKLDTRYHLVLRIRDNESKPDTSVSHITSFQRNRSVDAVVTGPCAACVAAVDPQTTTNRLPIISLSPADLPSDATGSGSVLFKLAPVVADDAAVMVDGMERQHVQSLGVVVAGDDYGDSAAAAMRVLAGKAHLPITQTYHLGGGGTMGTLSDPVTGLDPGAVAVWASPGDADSAVAELHKNGFQGHVYLDGAAAGSLFFDQSADLNGAYLTFPEIMAMDDLVASTPAQADQKRWFEDYTSQYGQYAGPSSFAADAVSVIADAVQAAHGTDRPALRSAIEATQLDGLSGTIRFTPLNHSGLSSRSLTLLRASNGRWHASSLS